MRHTKIFVADANSTDGTPELADGFCGRLDVEVIPGGLPSVGRNAGAHRALTPYVLFLDADIELNDFTLIRRSVEKMQRKQLHCLTTNIWCREGNRRDQLLYAANDAAQWLSRFFKPFSTGMFMMFDRERFLALGGFNERALYAEDYQLSKQVRCRKFGVVGGKILTTNRRFQKMGHMKVVRMFLRTMLNSWNENYFLLDQKYWQA